MPLTASPIQWDRRDACRTGSLNSKMPPVHPASGSGVLFEPVNPQALARGRALSLAGSRGQAKRDGKRKRHYVFHKTDSPVWGDLGCYGFPSSTTDLKEASASFPQDFHLE
jgi:hypothetical protein